MKKLILTATALVALALPAHAAKKSPTPDFVQKVAISDMFEIQSSKTAQQKSGNSDIKSFAGMMVTDHAKTSDQLKSTAGSLPGVQIPSDLDASHKKQLDQLNGLDGAKFDSAYKSAQVKGHEQAVRLFQNYADNGDNPDLKKWASDTLPTLREHLRLARALPKSK